MSGRCAVAAWVIGLGCALGNFGELRRVAGAQNVYFSMTGTFTAASGQSVDVPFNVALNNSSLTLRTQAWSGGTNFAGQTIPAGGIDSILTLFNAANTQLATNDDVGGGLRDSLISPTATGTANLPPVGSGDYRLNLTNFTTSVGDGHWSLDIGMDNQFLPELTVKGVLNSASSTLNSVAFGVNVSAADATLTLGAGIVMSMTGPLVMGSNAHLVLNGGTLSTAIEFSGGNGQGASTMDQTAGLHTVTGDNDMGLVAGWGSVYNLSGGTFTVGGNENLGPNFSGSAQFNQSGGYHSAGALNIGSGSSGVYSLSGGTFQTGQILVGYIGVGTINQSGGVANVNNLWLGYQGTATFNQTGGLFNAPGGVAINPYGSPNPATWSIGSFATASLGFSGLSIGFNGAASLNGGTLAVGTITTSGNGFFSFGTGTLNITSGDLAVGTLGLLGPNLQLSPSRVLSISGLSTIAPNATLTLNGGTFSTGSLSTSGGSGIFNFLTGTLRITAANLSIGATGPLGTNYSLDAGHRIDTTGSNNLTVDSGAILDLNGGSMNLGGGAVNNGQILFTSPLSILSGGTLSNSGLISGSGRVGSNVNNTVNGEVRAASSDALRFLAAGNSNAGSINLFGGLVEFTGSLSNSATGRITGHGQFLVHGGLTNNGSLVFSSNESDVTGAITNAGFGKTIVTGGATATFYDPVTNTGSAEFRVSTNSTAVFLGNVTGLGLFTGPGVKDFEAGASSGAIMTMAGSTIVGPGATVTAQFINENSLTVEGNAAIVPNGTSASTSRIASLNIDGAPGAWTGKLDLADNDMILDYSGTSPIATVQDQIKSGYNSGSWTGNGITSSAAAAASTSAHRTALAYVEASQLGTTSFSGQSVDDTALLIRYTLAGDSDLSGKVDLTDFTFLAANFNGSNKTWLQGDYNYDGKVDLTDFTFLASNFNQSIAATDERPWTIGDTVPEPLGVPALTIGAGMLLKKRRRFSSAGR